MKTIEMYKFILVLALSNVCNSVWSPKVVLPEKLIVGYPNPDRCDDQVIQAAKDGLNTITWFSIDLLHNYTTGKPYINRGPDPECVARVAKTLKDLHLETVHLITIGGWGAPHPDTTNTAEEYFAEWKRWNNEVIAKPELEFFGYDGIDWDTEGTDEVANERNEFKVETLDLMGKLSQLMKKDGYIVSLVPAESYMDPTTSLFDRSLRNTYPEWDPIEPTFTYRGHNTYSYLLSKFATTTVDTSQNGLAITAPTFDFVTIQLYETFSHCLYNTSRLGQPASEYIRNIVQMFEQGWMVDFSSDREISWNTTLVHVPSSRLVIGLANGWADGIRVLLLNSTEVMLGYQDLKEMGQAPKGFGFWNIHAEGRTIPNGTEMWLTRDLNNFLHIRDSSGHCAFGSIHLITCSLVIGFNLLNLKIS